MLFIIDYDRDYNAIYAYLNLVNQEIEGKQIEKC